MSDFDQDLIDDLHRQVGDLIQREQSRRRGERTAPLTGEAERQFARGTIAKVLSAFIERRLSAGRPPLAAAAEDDLTEALMARLFGAGRLQRLLDDDTVENIDINGADEVWISRAGADFSERATPVAASDAELIAIVQTLGSYSGLSSRSFDVANPELDLQLPDGSRLSAVMAVAARPSVSIRRHRFQKVGLADLVGLGTMTEELAEFLRAAVKARLNIVISGGTNGGKTTMLRALASEIDPRERIITIEKAFELGLREDRRRHPNAVALEARLSNSEGVGEVTMAQLVKRTLRQNPDRVIVGEVLGEEIIPMLNAMSQGNDGSLSTIHSDAARQTFMRISSYAQQAENLSRTVVHEMIAGAIDLVVHIARDRHGGRRSVREVLEVNGFDDAIGVSASQIFAEGPGGDALRTHNVVQRAARLDAVGWREGPWGRS